MRLEKLTISGFRGFHEEREVSLSANVVILQGPNGSGKTSLIDAIQWLLLGDVARFQDGVLKKGEDYISNRYASGPPFVAADLSGPQGPVRVSRRGLGEAMQVQVDAADDLRLVGDQAQRWLDDAMGAQASELDSTELLRRHLLQQDDMREFLQADTNERYEFVASLTGMEHLTALDNQLTSELKAARKASRELEDKVEAAETALSAARVDREESRQLLEERTAPVSLERARTRGVALLGIDDESLRDTEALVDALSARSDEILEALEQWAELERRLRLAGKESRDPRSDEADLIELRSQVEVLADQSAQARKRLVTAEEGLAAAKLTADKAQQLAVLALDQVEGSCPVCGQEHDHEATLSRLMRLLETSPELTEETEAVDSGRLEVADIATKQTDAARELAELETAVHQRAEAEQTVEQLTDESKAARESLEKLIPPVKQGTNELEKMAGDRRHEIGSVLLELRRGVDGELSNRRAARRVSVLEEQFDEQRKNCEELQRALGVEQTRVKSAEEVRKKLGGQLNSVMSEVANGSTYLINEIYRRLDVHPTFQEFGFHTQRHRETGHLRPWVYDRRRRKEGNALHVLSAAQLNSLAICLFLALNLESRTNLRTAILDDPVQSLDDVNLLSLADVLRTVRAERQVIVSTHDETLAALLIRKLRPLQAGDATMVVTIDQWGEAGPRVRAESREHARLEPELELLAEDGG